MKREFKVNKGADSEMEFKGFTAQYITYAALGLFGSLLLFTLIYFLGFPFIPNAMLCGLIYAIWHLKVYQLNKKYKHDGLLKKNSYQKVPHAIKIQDREFFISLKSNHKNGNGNDNSKK